MRRTLLNFALLALSLALAALLAAADAASDTGCAATRIERAVPGGDERSSLRIECDEDAPPDAAAVCAAAPAEQRVACEEAVERRQEALRQARLRAALRRGASDDELVEEFDAGADELDRLRESAARSGSRSVSAP